MIALCAAMILDALFGEPRWLWDKVPHPAVVMGKAVRFLDNRLNLGTAPFLAGLITLLVLCIGAGTLGWLLSFGGMLVEIVVVAILLAQRSLADHVRTVGRDLRMSLRAGRRAVAMIVSRDTEALDESGVARSAIESAAENFSDGITAPAFWFIVGGLPGIMIYKVVNTADSMIGYRTARYEQFGKAAARFDDLLNLIPARLSAMLLAIPNQLQNWREIAADANLHRSPNAGWPEAAMARAIDVALAGPRTYDGKRTDFPFVNPKGRHALSSEDVKACVRQLWQAWSIALAACALLAILT